MFYIREPQTQKSGKSGLTTEQDYRTRGTDV